MQNPASNQREQANISICGRHIPKIKALCEAHLKKCPHKTHCKRDCSTCRYIRQSNIYAEERLKAGLRRRGTLKEWKFERRIPRKLVKVIGNWDQFEDYFETKDAAVVEDHNRFWTVVYLLSTKGISLYRTSYQNTRMHQATVCWYPVSVLLFAKLRLSEVNRQLPGLSNLWSESPKSINCKS